MMNNKYSDEQIKVINNNNDYLIVSAGPGAGKTKTIVGYLENEEEMHKQIIVSSFTKNSTYEIKKRFKKCNNSKENICFQTFDSFLIEKIWKFYFNRILKWIIEQYNYHVNKEILIHEFGIQLRNIKYKNEKDSWYKLRNLNSNLKWWLWKVQEFVMMCKQGTLCIGSISEFILWKFLKKNQDIMYDYLNYTFYKIIVDEAQDLNWIRHEILWIFYKKYGIKVVLVGDERQTLYEFIGARQNIFKYLLEKDNSIKKLELINNFRYKGNKDYINKMWMSTNIKEFVENLKCACENNHIELIENNHIENYIDKNDNSIDDEIVNLFLTSDNESVKEISKILEEKNIKNRATLKYNEVKVKYDHKVFIENICIYYKLKNREMKWTEKYSTLIEDIIDFIWPFDANKNEKFLNLFHNKNGININKIINKIAQLTQIPNLKKIFNTFSKDERYLENVKRQRNEVMTIHSAKGLEANNVFIDWNTIKKFINEYKEYQNSSTKFNKMYAEFNKMYAEFNKMYVAISRVKKKIFIFNKQNKK